jgi:hypothetical protein
MLEPRAGQELAASDAARTPLRVQAERGDFLIELGLDGGRGRPVSTLPEAPTLADLAQEPTLTEGEHFVVAALRRDENAPARFAISRFSVGQSPRRGAAANESGGRPPEKAALPLVYCGRPVGSYYAARGTSLLLDFAIDGFELGPGGTLLVRASRLRDPASAREARLRELGPRFISGIDGGDWQIELSLQDAAGKSLAAPFARASCTLTYNEVSGP